MPGRESKRDSWDGLKVEITGKGALNAAAALGLGETAVKQVHEPKRSGPKKRTIVDMLREVGINGR